MTEHHDVFGAIPRNSYYRVGRGPPLVWLPAAQGHWRFYDLWADTLGRVFTVFVPTLRGERDFEPHPHFDWSILVRDVLDDLDRLGWSRVWVGGASFGAALTLILLTRAPERFEGAFVYAPPWERPGLLTRRLIQWLDRREAWRLIGKVFRHYSVIALAHEFLRLPRTQREAYQRWFLERWQRYRMPVDVLGRRVAMVAELMDHVIPEVISTPVWVLAGARDWLVPARKLRKLAHRLPQGHFVLIREAGHLGPQTHSSLVARAIAEVVAHELPMPTQQL